MLESKRIKIGILVFFVFIGIFFRFVYLTADPPKNITISGGVVGDPGQYSLPARNKILFDVWAIEGWKTQWLSPAIVYLNYYLYKIFGISLFAHRLIPFIFSSLTLIFIVFFILYKEDYLLALFFSIFYSFNYPSIIYSKIANREFPMIFFFVVSIYFFSLAAKKKSNTLFFVSALFFGIAYLSKGSILYLVSVFVIIGGLWLVEKRIRVINAFIFFFTLMVFFLGWYLFVFSLNKNFFALFYKNNLMVRGIDGIKEGLLNLWASPFLLLMRNDWLLILFSFIGIAYYLYKKIFLREKLGEVIELSIAWLGIGLVANGIVNYRPTRFYIILIISYLLILSFFLKDFLESKVVVRKNYIFYFLIIYPLIFYVGGGFYFIDKCEIENLVFFLLLIIVFFLLSGFLKKSERKLKIFLTIILILSSIFFNLKFLYHWNKNVEYKIKHISNLLSKVIPPSNIAGNWASILCIGTLHKTFYTWPGFANSDKDFLRRNKVKYIILAKGKFADELSIISNYFKEDFRNAKLMAIFSLYNTKVYLFSLDNKNQEKTKIEFERLYFNSKYRKVVFDEKASQKMAVEICKRAKNVKFFPDLIFKSDGKIIFVGRGNFRVKLNFLFGHKEIIRNFKVKNLKYTKKEIFLPVNENMRLMEVEVYKIRSSAFLDYLSLN